MMADLVVSRCSCGAGVTDVVLAGASPDGIGSLRAGRSTFQWRIEAYCPSYQRELEALQGQVALERLRQLPNIQFWLAVKESFDEIQ